MPAGPTVQMAVAALHGEDSPRHHPQGYALLTVDHGGASLAVWLNLPAAPESPRLDLLTPVGPVEAEPGLSGVPGLYLFLLAPSAGSLSSGLLLEFPETAVCFQGDWVWLTSLPGGHSDRAGDRSQSEPQSEPQSGPEPEPTAHTAEPEPEPEAGLDSEPEIMVRPLALEAPTVTAPMITTTPVVTSRPDPVREVTLKPGPALPFHPAGKAQVNSEQGSLSLTLRGLPAPARFGTDPVTGRPYAQYHAWLHHRSGLNPCPAGPCRHGWGGNYSLEVRGGLPLAEFDCLVITAGEAATGPSILTGALPWAR